MAGSINRLFGKQLLLPPENSRIDVAIFLIRHEVLRSDLYEALMRSKISVRVLTDATMNTAVQRPMLEGLARTGIMRLP